MNPYVIVAAMLALTLSFAGGAKLGYDYSEGAHARAEAEKNAFVQQIREANLQFADSVAKQTASAIANIRIQNKTINNDIYHEKEIHRDVLYNPDCSLPASTVRVLNAARGYSGVGSSPNQPSPAMPSASTAEGSSSAGRSGTGRRGSGSGIP